MPSPQTLDAVAGLAREVADLDQRVATKRSALRAACVTAARDGHGDNEIVRQAKGGLSRRLVFEALGLADLEGDVRAALKGLSQVEILIQGGRVSIAMRHPITPEVREMADRVLREAREDPNGDLQYATEEADKTRAAWTRAYNAAAAAESRLREAGLTLSRADADLAEATPAALARGCVARVERVSA